MKELLLFVAGLPLLAFLVVTVVLIVLRYRKYAKHFDYARDQDTSVRLDPTKWRRVEVEVDQDGFVWPASASGCDAAFLELPLHTGPLGSLLDPHVEVCTNGRRIRQYVERGTKGLRFVNLSALGPNDLMVGTRVELRGQHVRWKTAPATLHVTTNSRIPEEPILVVAPHPDDAELAAFGLYCDRDAWIVTITAGEQGTPGHTCGGVFDRSVESSRLRGRFRVWESITAPFAGSVTPERAVNLGYFDGTLEMMYRQQDAPVASQTADVSNLAFFRANNVSESLPATHGSATWHGLVGDLTELLRHIAPKTIVAPHPRLEHSRDHIFAGIAVRQAIVRAGLTKGTLLEYVVHPWGAGRRSSLHPVGARDGIVSLPPVVPDYAVGAAYTHLLSSEQVVRKLLALDVFRDLRDIETAIEPPLIRDIYERVREIFRTIVVPRNHFVRKACRPNELFFVLPFADLPRDTESVERSIQSLLRADRAGAVAG